MTPLPASRYLETQVLTASPQRLRLMLIEAAMRAVQATQEAWNEARWDAGLEANIKCRDIVAELLGVDPTTSPIARDVAGIYAFLFATLTDANTERDGSKLRDVLRILEVERETWLQVCEQLAPVAATTGAEYKSDLPAVAPAVTANDSDAGGFSVEA